MKILKLLNRLSILIFFLILSQVTTEVFSNEPVDIWNLEKKKNTETEINADIIIEESNSIFQNQSNKKNNNKILEGENLQSDNVLLVGLYDPEENGLNIEMWTNSDGEELKSILNKINITNLSTDAKEILQIALLTNSYFPEKNISYEEFLEFKSNFLLKKKDLNLIKKFLTKNNKTSINYLLIQYYVNEYLSISDLETACSIFKKVKFVDDDYLTKFRIYCLVNEDRREEAQLIFDLKKELGFNDDFFEKKINFLLGYDTNNETEISEKNILDFHLSHRTNPEFSYNPSNKTSKIIWRYLSSFNLLEKVDLINLEDEEKIKIIEKATHEKNYTETELFDLYKRFQFNINQLLTAKDTYKLLPSYKGRALLYQRLLLTIDTKEKLDLSLKLKKSFEEDNIAEAFTDELSKILKVIEIKKIPSNYSTFYEENLITEKNIVKKIKYNNKIVHQSKLLNYFSNESSVSKTEKETNDLLKKIKKDKKYFFSTKDIMMLDSLKSDGVKISNKYNNLYESNPDIPVDIQFKINNGEIGLVLLRIVEIIGEDNLEDLGTESLNFIISVLNKLNMDKLRNKILLKVLPLKV